MGGTSSESVPGRRTRPSPSAVLVLLGVSVFPFAGFAYENRDEPLPLLRLAVFALVVWVIALAAWGIAVRVRPRLDPDRAAIGVAAAVFSFFSFSWWLKPGALPGPVALLLWAAVTAAAVVLLYRLARSDLVRTFLVSAAVLLPLVPLAGITIAALEDPPSSAARPRDPPVELSLDEDAERPNIYHFVLDFHGRTDQIEELTGYDNAAFLDELEQRGFTVADEALASYPITALSVSSTLDMGYLATEPDDVAGGLEPFYDVVRGDNWVVEQLRAAGYTFVYSPNGTFNGFDCSTELADVCIAPTTRGLPVSDVEHQLIELTPLGALDLVQTPFTEPTYVVDEVQRLDPPEPYFVLAHVISPHPPYRFEEDCSRRRVPSVRRQAEREREQREYAIDVRCIDADLVAAIDEIRATDPDAVIIVQSDHGPEFLTPWYVPLEDWSDEALLERYAVLNAMALPEGCEHDVREDEALVNTYRLLFACLNGDAEVDRLDHRAFLFRWGDEDDLVPIDPDRLSSP